MPRRAGGRDRDPWPRRPAPPAGSRPPAWRCEPTTRSAGAARPASARRRRPGRARARRRPSMQRRKLACERGQDVRERLGEICDMPAPRRAMRGLERRSHVPRPEHRAAPAGEHDRLAGTLDLRLQRQAVVRPRGREMRARALERAPAVDARRRTVGTREPQAPAVLAPERAQPPVLLTRRDRRRAAQSRAGARDRRPAHRSPQSASVDGLNSPSWIPAARASLRASSSDPQIHHAPAASRSRIAAVCVASSCAGSRIHTSSKAGSCRPPECGVSATPTMRRSAKASRSERATPGSRRQRATGRDAAAVERRHCCPAGLVARTPETVTTPS